MKQRSFCTHVNVNFLLDLYWSCVNSRSMYIERVPNRNSPPAVLLRKSWRENGKIRKRTIANLSGLSNEIIDALRAALKGESIPSDQGIPNPEKSVSVRS